MTTEAAATPSNPRRTVALPIESVTVLEDRAQVRRRGTLPLEAGLNRLCVPGVAPTLVDRTLSVRLAGLAGAEIAATQILRQRVLLDEDVPERVRQLRDQERGLREEVAHTCLRRERHELTRADLLALLRTTLAEVEADCAYGRADPRGAAARLASLREADERWVAETVALRVEAERLQQRLRDVQERRAAAESPGTRATCGLLIDIDARASGEVELVADMVVAGACWRPYHRARLEPAAGGTRLRFDTDACIWQNTGEDWPAVELLLSTQRSSQGAEPPRLASDTLSARKTDDRVEIETREETLQVLGGSPRRQESDVMPGVDDGGSALVLRAATAIAIPADGRPQRVSIASFVAPAEVSYVAFPERATAVLLRSRQVNQGNQPILAGPVDLIRDSGLVGRTQVLFVAPGERFELGWGADPACRVHRRHQEREDDKGLLSAWTRTRHLVDVHLSNLGAEARQVEITERIPVSEVEKVRVEHDPKAAAPVAGATINPEAGSTPDPDGMVRWSVRLEPHSHRLLRLGWTVATHSKVSP